MPSGDVAPGWVLPTWGFGHHHDAAMPVGGARSVTSVPMNGSTDSIITRDNPGQARAVPSSGRDEIGEHAAKVRTRCSAFVSAM